MPRLTRPLVLAGLGAGLAWLARPRVPRLPAPPPPAPVPVKRILAIKLADIGDALGIEPALAALRACYPDATLDVLVTPGARQALSTCPHVDEIIDFNKHLFDRVADMRHPANLLTAARFVTSLRRRRYDAVVLFHHLSTTWGAFKFDWVTRLTGARTIAGLDNGRGDFLSHAALDRGFGACREWEYWLAVVEALGVPVVARPPRFHVPETAELAAAALLAARVPDAAGPLVALHAAVGGYAPLKQWPLERFVAVARALVERDNATVLLLGGDDMRLLGADLVRRIGRGAVDLTGQTDIPALAAVLRRCRLTIGNDSGVVHLADAVGCPVLTVFGPTSAEAWAPGQTPVVTLDRVAPEPPAQLDRSAALRVNEPCSPCYYVGLSVRERGRCPHRSCLHHLPPTTVTTVARHLLTAS